MVLEYRLLSVDEVAEALLALPEWGVVDGMLTREFSFKAYKDGLVFASVVGYLADAMDHHPDMLVSYGKVRVNMNTHAVKGLSPYDLELARRIDAIG